MRLILAGVAALALAGPAGAQRVFTPEAEDDVVRAIPPASQVEAIGEAMDRVLGAVLDMPIGPLVDAIDAADPQGRRDRRFYPRDARVGDVASRDDPYFEDRLRDSIHRNSANMGRAMEQIAIAAPALRRALGEVERNVERSIDESRERYEQGRERRGRR
ncbi:MAG TPA: hypothetical protein VGB79_16650 [Allosphingosinicella sp.]|jgi:hypothetical protein